MAELKWIKITTDIFDDEKILLIESMPDSDSLIVIWFKILALAGKSCNDGLLMIANKIPYTDEMLATIFRRPKNTVKLALETFEALGMLEIVDEVIRIANWDKHQNIEGIERIREQNRIRKANQRERERASLPEAESVDIIRECHVTSSVTSRDCHATEENRIEETRLDENREEQIRLEEEEGDARESTSTTPTLDDVDSFCRENGLHLDTKKFFYYYSGQGWKDKYGNSIDWKSKAASWSSSEFPNKTQHTSSTPSGASATPKPSNGRYSGVPGKAEFDAVRRRNGLL